MPPPRGAEAGEVRKGRGIAAEGAPGTFTLLGNRLTVWADVPEAQREEFISLEKARRGEGSV